jgi:ATP-dependent DNA helicase RecG
MIEVCLENGLPEPEFKSGKGWFEISFSTQIYRDEVWNKLGLNERQIQAMQYLNRVGRITNAEYRRFIGVPVYTAKRDLAVLVEKGLLKKEGPAGKAVYYVLDEMKYAEK